MLAVDFFYLKISQDFSLECLESRKIVYFVKDEKNLKEEQTFLYKIKDKNLPKKKYNVTT